MKYGRWALPCMVLAGCGRIDFDAVTDRCALHALIDEPYANSFDGADGVTAPFLVCSDAQLARIAARPQDWDKAFEVGADIDLAGVQLTPIGTATQPFTGTFDGAGHSLLNVRLAAPVDGNLGLFAHIGDRAHLTSVSLHAVDIAGAGQVGALVGLADQNILIEHIHVDGTIRGTDAMFTSVGGVIGYAGCYTAMDLVCAQIVIRDVTADVDVEGPRYVAGVIGGLYNEDTFAHLSDLHVSGRVKATSYAAGGIIADMEAALLEDSSSSATLECVSSCGGAVGTAVYTNRTMIRRTSSTGQVTCTTSCGGLTGDIEGSIERSYSTGNVTTLLELHEHALYGLLAVLRSTAHLHRSRPRDSVPACS